MAPFSVIIIIIIITIIIIIIIIIVTAGDEAKDAAQRKSVCWDYTTQLVTMVIMNAEGTQIIEKYGSRLLTISEDGKSH